MQTKIKEIERNSPSKVQNQRVYSSHLSLLMSDCKDVFFRSIFTSISFEKKPDFTEEHLLLFHGVQCEFSSSASSALSL